MAKERTLDEALDLFDSWEQAAQMRRSKSKLRTLDQLLADLENGSNLRLRQRRVRRVNRRSSTRKRVAVK